MHDDLTRFRALQRLVKAKHRTEALEEKKAQVIELRTKRKKVARENCDATLESMLQASLTQGVKW